MLTIILASLLYLFIFYKNISHIVTNSLQCIMDNNNVSKK